MLDTPNNSTDNSNSNSTAPPPESGSQTNGSPPPESPNSASPRPRYPGLFPDETSNGSPEKDVKQPKVTSDVGDEPSKGYRDLKKSKSARLNQIHDDIKSAIEKTKETSLDPDVQVEVSKLFVLLQGISRCLSEVDLKLVSIENKINPPSGSDGSKIYVSARATATLTKQQNDLQIKEEQLESLVSDIYCIASSLEGKPNKILATRLRRNTEFEFRKLENKRTGRLINWFKNLIYVTRTRTKMLLGLVVAVPIYVIIAPSLIGPLLPEIPSQSLDQTSQLTTQKSETGDKLSKADLDKIYKEQEANKFKFHILSALFPLSSCGNKNNPDQTKATENQENRSASPTSPSGQPSSKAVQPSAQKTVQAGSVPSPKTSTKAPIQDNQNSTTTSASSTISPQNKPLFCEAEYYDMLAWLTIAALGGFLGSVTSILSRLQDYKSNGEYDTDRETLVPFYNGLVKPLIGVSFSIFVVCVIKSNIFPINLKQDTGSRNQNQTLGLFAIVFVVGFSERFATDLIKKVELSNGPSPDENRGLPETVAPGSPVGARPTQPPGEENQS